MTKEERQKKFEELKEQRKVKTLERKRAREEKDQEKVWLKREEHKAILKRTKGLLRWTKPPSTVVCEEDVVPIPEVYPEPSTSAQGADPLETPLVESGPLLVSLNLFPSGDKDDDEPPSASQFGRPSHKSPPKLMSKHQLQLLLPPS